MFFFGFWMEYLFLISFQFLCTLILKFSFLWTAFHWILPTQLLNDFWLENLILLKRLVINEDLLLPFCSLFLSVLQFFYSTLTLFFYYLMIFLTLCFDPFLFIFCVSTMVLSFMIIWDSCKFSHKIITIYFNLITISV